MQVPRRKLTEHEQELLSAVRDQAMTMHQSRRDKAKASAEQARQLVDQLATEFPDADAAGSARQMLKAAEIHLADVDNDIQIDTEELAFIAGRWAGFIAGIQYVLAGTIDDHGVPG